MTLVVVKDQNGNRVATADIDPDLAMRVVDVETRVDDSQGVVVVTLVLRDESEYACSECGPRVRCGVA